MKKHRKQIPKFKSEDEEREFWATHSPYQSLLKMFLAERLEAELRPSTKYRSTSRLRHIQRAGRRFGLQRICTW
jgi:hypothetical protein